MSRRDDRGMNVGWAVGVLALVLFIIMFATGVIR